MSKMYQKIKRQNGERFAQTLRNFHSGILEIPDIDKIVRHAGRDAEPLLPYFMGLLAAKADAAVVVTNPQNPFDLLAQAGYDAFHAKTLKAQNSIRQFFHEDELLCTFDDPLRYRVYHMVHAVKKDVDTIRREDFEGIEDRQDRYGTSVISIQMLKKGGFISIKNRYNNSVNGADNTYKSNPDNIIAGLSAALKHHFNVDFSNAQGELPETDFVLMGDQVFNYYKEDNNFYYGNQAWAKDGVIHEVDRCVGDLLFEGFLFNNKDKVFEKIDPDSEDSFADDFNRDYGGNPALNTRNGNLYLGDELLIGAERSRITKLCLNALERMSRCFLRDLRTLTHFESSSLREIEENCIIHSHGLECFKAPSLVLMGEKSFVFANSLKRLYLPSLVVTNEWCFANVPVLEYCEAKSLEWIGPKCFTHAPVLTHFEAPNLRNVPDYLEKFYPASPQESRAKRKVKQLENKI